MSKLRQRTVPDFSISSPFHQQDYLADIKSDHDLYSRNVIDRFKDVPTLEIKKQLKETAFPYAVCCENWSSDFNFSTLVRNANAFNALTVYYLGDKRWDRRGAQGSQNYSEVQWLPTIDDFLKLKESYVFIGIDNIDGSIPLRTYSFPKNALLIFGSEGCGLTPEMQSLCDVMIGIEQFGSIRSLNCGTASGVVMYELTKQWTTR